MILVFGRRDEGAEGAVTREPRTQRMLSAATPGFDTRTNACKHSKHALSTEPTNSARCHDSQTNARARAHTGAV